MPEAALNKQPESVRSHADKLIAQLADSGKIPTPTEPDFSGEPSTPQFAQTTVAPNVDTQPQPPAATPPPAATTEQPPADAPAAAAPAPSAGTQAADAAAAAIADPFGEYDEFEVDEPDFPDMKIPVRVPKQYAQIMKRAIPRRADYDRIRGRWREYADQIEPLIRDGQIKQYLPFIEMAQRDQEFAQFVEQAARRRLAGLPMTEQVRQAVEQAATQAAPATDDQGFVDPFLEEALKNDPRIKRLETIEQRLERQEQERREQQVREQQMREQQVAFDTQLRRAHDELGQRYPGRFTPGVPNDPAFSAAFNYAKQAGWLEDYGYRAGIIFGADAVYRMEQERLAATASPAARMIENGDVAAQELARQQAAKLAAGAAGGTTQPSAPVVPPPKPSRTNPDGSLKSREQFMAEMSGWVSAQQA